MQIDFEVLFFAALVGTIAAAVVGWDPWKLAGQLMLGLTLLPLFRLAFETDPQVVQEATNSMIGHIVDSIPSTFIGEMAGIVAGWILRFAKDLSKGI